MISKSPVSVELELPPRRRLIGVSLLPAAATLGNLLCGFLAIYCCLLATRAEYAEYYAVQPRVFHSLEKYVPTHVAAGAYLIALAMIFDALDGRLARMTRRTSEFGAQLDSIADIVSFGAAPALLFVTLLLRPAIDAAAEEPDVSKLQARFGMASALVYVSCAAIRLARYNAENVKTEAAQRAFSGLPSPGAAAAIVALLALHEHVRHKGLALGSVDWPDVARWVIAGTAFIVGLLMVSRLDYVHIFNVYVRRKHPPTHLVWLIALLGLIGVLGVWRYSLELLMVVVALAYVASGPVVYLMNRRRRAAVTLQAEPLPKPALRAEDL